MIIATYVHEKEKMATLVTQICEHMANFRCGGSPITVFVEHRKGLARTLNKHRNKVLHWESLRSRRRSEHSCPLGSAWHCSHVGHNTYPNGPIVRDHHKHTTDNTKYTQYTTQHHYTTPLHNTTQHTTKTAYPWAKAFEPHSLQFT